MVLTSASPKYLHILQNLALILISLASLPVSTVILVASFALRPLLLLRQDVGPTLAIPTSNGLTISSTQRVNGSGPPNTLTTASSSYTIFPPVSHRRTILVTGVDMTKGLHLARTFYLANHRVIGADVAPYNTIAPIGRFSRAVDRFYALPSPNEQEGSAQYIHTLLTIIHREKVDLWVSCSGVASALDDARAKEVIERRSDCLCIQFGVATTQLLHEKDAFTTHAASLGLPVPETHNVTSRDAVHKVLHQSPRTKKRYIMKSVNLDDASRAEIMTVLPRRTLSETYNHVARIPISESKPWVLQQYVPGKREYCTHSLVVRGRVKAFVACPSSELLMHYEQLPHSESALSRAMLKFTEEFATKTKDESGTGGFTGHLSFDFLVDEMVTERGVESVLRAIECNPRAHTAVALFAGREKEMAAAYLTALDGERKRTNGTNEANGSTSRTVDWLQPDQETDYESDIVFPLPSAPKRYWIGHDLTTLIFLPLLHLFGLSHPIINLPTYIFYCRKFLDHLLFWHDGTYEVWDPLPAWWLYHVYWPGQFLLSILCGKRWSRVNVSTCKIFGC